jgi:hypothetical protein
MRGEVYRCQREGEATSRQLVDEALPLVLDL